MIPKFIHYYCNDSPRVDARADYSASWREKNPGFQHRMWSETAASAFIAEQFGKGIGKQFESRAVPLEKASLFAAAVLLVHGGFYVGCSLECLEPIEKFFELAGDVVAVSQSEGTSAQAGINPLARGFLGACPRAPQLGRMFAALATRQAVRDAVRGFSWRKELQAADFDEQEKSSITWLAPDVVQRFVRVHSQEDGSNINSSQGDLAVQGEGAARAPVRWANLLFLGHPRCGSTALSAMLKSAGVRVEHERLGRDGAVSWWLVGRRIPDAAWPIFLHGPRENKEIWPGGRIFHYLRDPRDAIPSIVLENEARMRANPSFQLRRRTLRERFGVDINELDVPTAAATSYALWNRLAEELASDGVVLVEKPELSNFLPGVGSLIPHRANTSLRKFGTTKPDIDIADAIRRSPYEAREQMERYLSLYR
jgi:hypothetical protein